MIKGVDRDKWITMSNISVPLKACTAIAVDIAGAGMLTGILDLFFDKKTHTGEHQQMH